MNKEPYQIVVNVTYDPDSARPRKDKRVWTRTSIEAARRVMKNLASNVGRVVPDTKNGGSFRIDSVDGLYLVNWTKLEN